MILGSDIITRLTNDSGIAAIIADRAYPSNVLEADKVYPLIVYKKENIDAGQCYSGPTGLQSCDVIIACMSTNHDEAENLAQTVLNSIDGETATWGTVNVQGCFLKDDGISENVFTQETSEDLTVYITELNFTVWYNTPPYASSSSSSG